MTSLTFLMKRILIMQLSKNITLQNQQIKLQELQEFGLLIPTEHFMKMGN